VSDGANGHADDSDLSPIQQVRARRHGDPNHGAPENPDPGERGQVHSSFHGRFLDFIGRANPEQLSIETFRKMELDPQVRAGIAIRELAILGQEPTFSYTPIDDEDPDEKQRGREMVAFLEWVWNNLTPSGTKVLRNILSARRFGFSVQEKVWASYEDPDTGESRLRTVPEGHRFEGNVWVEKVKHLPPESFEDAGFSVDAYGNLRRVHQRFVPRTALGRGREGGSPSVVDRGDDHGVRITFEGDDLDRLILYTANEEAGNLYGRSDHRQAYNHWYAKNHNHSARNILLERTSGVLVGGYSEGSSQENLENALEDVGPGAVLTRPKEDEVDLLTGWEGAVSGYQEALRYDDVQILRAYLVPPLTLGGGAEDTGSFARAESDFDSFLLSVKQIQIELQEVVQKDIVEPLIDANWGPQERYPQFSFPEMTVEERSQLANVWSQAIQDGYVDPEIDARWLREELNVPEEAPEDHEFTTPEPETATEDEDAPGGGLFETAKAQEESPPSVFEEVDTPRANEVTVEHLENTLKQRLTNAALDLKEQLVEDPPTDASPNELDKVSIPARPFERILDDVAEDVLDEVTEDTLTKFRQAGLEEVADRIEETMPDTTGDLNASSFTGKLRAVWHRARAQDDIFELLQSYFAWVESMNETQANDLSSELENRLRMRVSQAYQRGFDPEDIPAQIAEEFASYKQSEIDSVARTTVMDMYNTGRSKTFEAAGDFVEGVRFVNVSDSATTEFCDAIDGRSIRKENPNFERVASPPFWYECRTTTVPIFRSENHDFDQDWDEWLQEHRDTEGGGFVFGRA